MAVWKDVCWGVVFGTGGAVLGSWQTQILPVFLLLYFVLSGSSFWNGCCTCCSWCSRGEMGQEWYVCMRQRNKGFPEICSPLRKKGKWTLYGNLAAPIALSFCTLFCNQKSLGNLEYLLMISENYVFSSENWVHTCSSQEVYILPSFGATVCACFLSLASVQWMFLVKTRIHFWSLLSINTLPIYTSECHIRVSLSPCLCWVLSIKKKSVIF